MKRLRLFAIAVAFGILAACATFGVDPPQTFNQRVAAAQITVTAVRSSALSLLNAEKISVADAKNVQASADAGNAAIDLALTSSATDPTGANNKLAAAIAILTGVQTYLATKGAK
jgi:hypothetical protein